MPSQIIVSNDAAGGSQAAIVNIAVEPAAMSSISLVGSSISLSYDQRDCEVKTSD
tara:strand:- start:53 stop:217 length:165 start_codon:yes stop_codon:yes gene_type:complete